jgi:hypothetical protein
LPSKNDGQIMAAPYLNLIGDVYVHCRQGELASYREDEYLINKFGSTHTIRKFKHPQHLEEALLASAERSAYFDIELYFFIYRNQDTEGGKNFTYMSKKKIIELFSPKAKLTQWVFDRLRSSNSSENLGAVFYTEVVGDSNSSPPTIKSKT